jgi:hypothetical protein
LATGQPVSCFFEAKENERRVNNLVIPEGTLFSSLSFFLSFFFVFISVIRRKEQEQEQGPLDFAKYSHTSRRVRWVGGDLDGHWRVVENSSITSYNVEIPDEGEKKSRSKKQESA